MSAASFSQPLSVVTLSPHRSAASLVQHPSAATLSPRRSAAHLIQHLSAVRDLFAVRDLSADCSPDLSVVSRIQHLSAVRYLSAANSGKPLSVASFVRHLSAANSAPSDSATTLSSSASCQSRPASVCSQASFCSQFRPVFVSTNLLPPGPQPFFPPVGQQPIFYSFSSS